MGHISFCSMLIVSLLGKNMLEKRHRSFITVVASKETGLETYIFLSHEQNAGQITTLLNQNCMHAEIKSTLNSGTFVQNFCLPVYYLRI